MDCVAVIAKGAFQALYKMLMGKAVGPFSIINYDRHPEHDIQLPFQRNGQLSTTLNTGSL